MKNSFVQELGDHIFTDVIENSYYNDECDVDCHTPDFDAAYNYIQSQSTITKKDLENVYVPEDLDTEGHEGYTGLDLLKLTISGDFDGENNYQSSELKNLRMCYDLINITRGDKDLWEYKKNEQPAKRTGWSNHEYKKEICDNTTLAGVVASRAESAAFRTGLEGLKLAVQIGKKLRSYAGFEGKQSCKIVEEGLKNGKFKKADMKKLAGYIKNERYEPLSNIQNYELRNLSINCLLYGKSGDKTFDSILDSIRPLKEIIAEKGKALEI
jgi:hypothetical protein